jgi:hypothetical protein
MVVAAEREEGATGAETRPGGLEHPSRRAKIRELRIK